MVKKGFDQKDLSIISALNEYGARTPTRELSKILNIPTRTLRHRLTKRVDIVNHQVSFIYIYKRRSNWISRIQSFYYTSSYFNLIAYSLFLIGPVVL